MESERLFLEMHIEWISTYDYLQTENMMLFNRYKTMDKRRHNWKEIF